MPQFKPKSALLVTRTIYFALIFGVVFFLVVSLILVNGSTFFRLDFSDPIFIVAIFLTITAIPAGYYISSRIAKFNTEDPFTVKWPVYQTRLIIKMASCEGSALFAIVGLMMAGNLAYIIMILIPLAVMISYFPSPDRIGQELELTQSDIDSLA